MKKQLTDLSLEELKKQEKALKTAAIVMGVCIALMFVSAILLTFMNKVNVFTFLPIVFLPLFMVNMNNLKKVKAAIADKSR